MAHNKKKQYIPKIPGKITLEQLSDVDARTWDGQAPLSGDKTEILEYHAEGLRYDLLWQPFEGAKRIFVMFSGDALRDRNDPPVFQRWSWASLFNGHCLFISDPALHTDDTLSLAWYSGTISADPLVRVAELLTTIAAQFGIDHSEIYSYGSSGGGFAALRLLSLMPEIAGIAINPQTNINAYKSPKVQKYYDTCFEGLKKSEMMAQFPKRISLLKNTDTLTGRRMLIAQNIQDEHHLSDHFTPLCDALGVPVDDNPDDTRLRRKLFDAEGGHKKAEDIETFKAIMKMVEDGL